MAEPKKTSTKKPASGKGTPQPPTSVDLNDLFQQLGIDPNSVALSAGMQTADDPPAWDGRTQRTSTSIYTDFYKMDRADVTTFQEQAYAAGLFGTMRRDQIRFGDHDDTTFKVWRSLVDRSAGYTAAGKKVSPWDALHQAAEVGKPEDANPLVTTASNPIDIRASIRDAAKEELGQGTLDDATVDRIVARYQSMQRGADTAMYAAGTAGGDVTGAPSLAAYTHEAVKEARPVQSEAYATIGAVDQIAQLMRGGQ